MSLRSSLRPSLSGVGGWAWAWGGDFVPGQWIFTFWSPELSSEMHRGFALRVQAGHLSSTVAGLAMSQVPRLLWKGRCQDLPGLLAVWWPHSGKGEKMGFEKWRWAVFQHPPPAPGSAHLDRSCSGTVLPPRRVCPGS